MLLYLRQDTWTHSASSALRDQVIIRIGTLMSDDH